MAVSVVIWVNVESQAQKTHSKFSALGISTSSVQKFPMTLSHHDGNFPGPPPPLRFLGVEKLRNKRSFDCARFPSCCGFQFFLAMHLALCLLTLFSQQFAASPIFQLACGYTRTHTLGFSFSQKLRRNPHETESLCSGRTNCVCGTRIWDTFL